MIDIRVALKATAVVEMDVTLKLSQVGSNQLSPVRMSQLDIGFRKK
ncbi:hypothetical protein KL86CLO1_12570 [uncultured Eubacteriales bacterium]|uniref:Uncharacterized protein n=1 Tax=uncultured Eubacteriales bacterium TaxID=172733 RepID=A0A212KBM2_9FIRM|nr:hypothetical protein KL86CLO1_12570 [uncultured Eubacteriales bacterium]